MKEKVTVIIPCYNNETTIEETLRSVQAQSYPNWEGIVVDDGSTDNTASVVKSLAAQDDRIKYILRNVEERGGSVCRNLGLKNSTGDYVMFLDADDLLTPECLFARVNEIKKTCSEFVVFTTATFGTKGIVDSNAFPTVRHADKRACLFLYAGTQAVWHTSSTLFRKSFVTALNGFDTRYRRLQDVEFHFRAVVESKNEYVIHEGSYDSLYRATESDGIIIRKFYDSIPSYRMMSEQISHYIESGFLSRDTLLSCAYLLLCTRYIRTLCVLRTGDKLNFRAEDYDFGWMDTSNLISFHYGVLSFLVKMLKRPSWCMRLCKFFDYMLRKSIVARC